MGPKPSKSASKSGSSSPKKKTGGGAKGEGSSSSLSGAPNSEYVQALKEFKLQWLRYITIVHS